MKCIFCGSVNSKVVDSRYLKDMSIRRRRECCNCGKRFTTYETVETNPMIVTNVSNVREPFKLDKLKESIQFAAYSRNIDIITEQSIVSEIEKRLLALQKQEITTMDIVKEALSVLNEVEPICALVYYTQHTNCKDMQDIREYVG